MDGYTSTCAFFNEHSWWTTMLSKVCGREIAAHVFYDKEDININEKTEAVNHKDKIYIKFVFK